MCMLLGMSKQLVYEFPSFYNKKTIYSNSIWVCMGLIFILYPKLLRKSILKFYGFLETKMKIEFHLKLHYV